MQVHRQFVYQGCRVKIKVTGTKGQRHTLTKYIRGWSTFDWKAILYFIVLLLTELHDVDGQTRYWLQKRKLHFHVFRFVIQQFHEWQQIVDCMNTRDNAKNAVPAWGCERCVLLSDAAGQDVEKRHTTLPPGSLLLAISVENHTVYRPGI